MGLSLKVGPVEDDVLRAINDVLRSERLPRVELPLDTDPFSDEVNAATAGLAGPAVLWHSYGIESLSCLLLFNAAKSSIASDYPLRFW